MKSTTWSYITYYLTYSIFINFSDEVPLQGKNVRDANVNEFPFVVSIEKRGHKGSNFCVGTLISPLSVLTAAHCLLGYKFNQVAIMIGSNDLREGKRYHPKSWISYDQWMNTTTDLKPSRNDIAVITLAEKVTKVNPASISTFSREDLNSLDVRIAGWGSSENDVIPMVLKTAVLKVISNDECESKIELLSGKPFYVSENYFCTLADPWVLGGCGDSGAPILNKQNQLVGIHYGICPKLEQYNYPKEFVNQNLVNTHSHLYQYAQFINDVKQ